jgi:hypothetical protein
MYQNETTMTNFNKITITYKLSKNNNITLAYLMPVEITKANPNEMANFLASFGKKQFNVEPTIKIETKSYKRVPKKYMMI